MMTIEGQCLLPVGRQRTGRSREEVGRGEDRQINDKSSIIMRVGQNGRKNDFSRKRSTLDFEEYLDPQVRVARLRRQALVETGYFTGVIPGSAGPGADPDRSRLPASIGHMKLSSRRDSPYVRR